MVMEFRVIFDNMTRFREIVLELVEVQYSAQFGLCSICCI